MRPAPAVLGCSLLLLGCSRVETILGAVQDNSSATAGAGAVLDCQSVGDVPKSNARFNGTDLPSIPLLGSAEALDFRPENLGLGAPSFYDAAAQASFEFSSGAYTSSESEFVAQSVTETAGLIRITVRPREPGDTETTDRAFVGGGVGLPGKPDYGLLVVRARPRTQEGVVMSLMFTADVATGWEGAIFEFGGAPTALRALYGGIQEPIYQQVDLSFVPGEDFHEYAIWSAPERVNYYVDGERVASASTQEDGIQVPPGLKPYFVAWIRKDDGFMAESLPTTLDIDKVVVYAALPSCE
jgi:hypothetical protein